MLQAVGDGAKRGLCGELHRGVGETHALGPRPDLLNGFLTGDVGAPGAAPGGLGGHLQEERGLAHAGIAAQQDRRARHHAAAADPVELVDAGGDAWRGRRLVLKPLERQAPDLGRLGGGHGAGRASLRFLDQGVPGAARRALARPLGLDGSTGLAGIDGAVAGHGGEGTPDSVCGPV
jgi:hypothetical protein